MPLYETERHEPLIGAPWSEARARAEIEQIAADTHGSFDPENLWPVHPFDRSPERPPDSLKTLYHGVAGVIWALNYLAETGAVPLGRDYPPTVRDLARRHRDDLRKYDDVRKYLGDELASYMMGETGILLLHWKLAPSDDLARQLHAAIEAKIGDPRGLAWGSAGTMLVALFMHERTGESRWKELFLRGFEALWNQWEYVDELRCHLWTHDLYGVSEWRIGAWHGFVGNAFPMLRGRHLLPPDRRDESLRRIYETLRATAVSEGEFANWPNNVGPTTRPAPLPLFVQHCTGAPGVISCMAEFPGDSRWPIDALLQQAGELVWSAGPPVKFPVLCHGAAGNGYAFLKLHARTGDHKWLERARAFAMHAIDRCESAVRKHGQRKYSLWTGDLGLAIYLWDCVRATAKIPTLDVF
ncbi:MAG TPA: LanC-like protein [Candidatus Binataceae bacterium]